MIIEHTDTDVNMNNGQILDRVIEKVRDDEDRYDDACVLVEYLVSVGLDVKAHGSEALATAVESGMTSTVKLLLRLGADPYKYLNELLHKLDSERVVPATLLVKEAIKDGKLLGQNWDGILRLKPVGHGGDRVVEICVPFRRRLRRLVNVFRERGIGVNLQVDKYRKWTMDKWYETTGAKGWQK